ncbi:MAG: hypothetical protein ACLR7Z_19090 [Bilophila wadsworthia]
MLDVIEQYGDRVPMNAHFPHPFRPTTESPCAIWSTSGQGSPACILQPVATVRARFNERIGTPVEWLPDAIAWVRARSTN